MELGYSKARQQPTYPPIGDRLLPGKLCLVQIFFSQHTNIQYIGWLRGSSVSLLFLTRILTTSMPITGYSVAIPASAVIISDWETYHQEAQKYPDTMVVGKYGGYVVEVGGEIKLATDNAMTKLINERLDAIGAANEGDDGAEDVTKRNTDLEGSAVLEKRACSHPRCFNSALCLSYTDCHVCTARSGTIGQGRCI